MAAAKQCTSHLREGKNGIGLKIKNFGHLFIRIAPRDAKYLLVSVKVWVRKEQKQTVTNHKDLKIKTATPVLA